MADSHVVSAVPSSGTSEGMLELVTTDSDLAPFSHDDPRDRRPADGATIHTGGEHASHLVVPVIPGG